MTTEGNKGEGTGDNTIPLSQFTELQSKFDNLYAKQVDLTKTLESFTKLGNPDDIRGKLEDYTSMKKDKAIGKPEEIERLVQEARTEESNAWKSKVTDYEKTIGEQGNVIRQYKISLPAGDAVSKFITDGSARFVREHIERVADLDGGAVIIKGPDGKPLRSVADPSKAMGLEEYVEKLAKETPEIAKAKGAGGVGSTGVSATANGDVSGVTVEAYLKMSEEQRRALPITVQQKLAPLALRAMSKR